MKSKNLTLASLFAGLLMFMNPTGSEACTRAVYLGPDNMVVTGRTMDWKEDPQSNLYLFPRGVQRRGAISDNTIQWTSKYGSVVTAGYDIGTCDGMNEKGLVANLLFLTESSYFRPDDNRPVMGLSIWTQYVLDNFATHKQVITVNGKNLRITVPAGVANGQTIKLKGQGGPGMNGGPAGDLYITFIIPDDSRFKRVGDDLYLTVPLNLYTAVLGGEQIIGTLDSKVKLKVKPGTQNNTKVRLKGKGFPVYKKEGQFGDLIVTYSIEVPTNLTEKQKELFREIQSLN